MRKLIFAVVGLGALCLTGCERAPRLEVRTFRLEHLDPDHVAQLIDPYVYSGRPVAPGTMSWTEEAITVRETRDNLDRIERLVREYDVAAPRVRLHFQLIEADGFTDVDPRIADVQAELGRLFQFEGYRLAAEVTVTTGGVGGSTTSMSQTMAVEESADASSGTPRPQVPPYTIAAVVRSSAEGVELRDFQLARQFLGEILHTTVTVHPGQTLVLGSSAVQDIRGEHTTLLLTVRAEEVS